MCGMWNFFQVPSHFHSTLTLIQVPPFNSSTSVVTAVPLTQPTTYSYSTYFQHSRVLTSRFVATAHLSAKAEALCSFLSLVMLSYAPPAPRWSASGHHSSGSGVMILSLVVFAALLVLKPAQCIDQQQSSTWSIPLSPTIVLTNQSHQCQSIQHPTAALYHMLR